MKRARRAANVRAASAVCPMLASRQNVTDTVEYKYNREYTQCGGYAANKRSAKDCGSLPEFLAPGARELLELADRVAGAAEDRDIVDRVSGPARCLLESFTKIS
ncbi:hypothetical protein A1O3_04513 [Capronia epimyces CBS 606.96]|uniref:Uncharacterized protein n=1 Tax=Capronia epimyces CBS 606.96 TaxID=1182542 RepID=W9Y4W1_9EURO|nr:uncharacterized protein A1O3_04513 [Capronia epimyces CBS 606.96]EXJ87553.1 hypothetical protein A1O3_04513 [Capronia epimyces CBS 606.96]